MSSVIATTTASASIRVLVAYVPNVADAQAVAVMPWLDRGGPVGDSGRCQPGAGPHRMAGDRTLYASSLHLAGKRSDSMSCSP
jgi:hypothetical protein